MGSNHRPSGYEPDELPLLYSAPNSSVETKAGAKVLLFFDITKFFGKKVQKKKIFCLKRLLFLYKTLVVTYNGVAADMQFFAYLIE